MRWRVPNPLLRLKSCVTSCVTKDELLYSCPICKMGVIIVPVTKDCLKIKLEMTCQSKYSRQVHFNFKPEVLLAKQNALGKYTGRVVTASRLDGADEASAGTTGSESGDRLHAAGRGPAGRPPKHQSSGSFETSRAEVTPQARRSQCLQGWVGWEGGDREEAAEDKLPSTVSFDGTFSLNLLFSKTPVPRVIRGLGFLHCCLLVFQRAASVPFRASDRFLEQQLWNPKTLLGGNGSVAALPHVWRTWDLGRGLFDAAQPS